MLVSRGRNPNASEVISQLITNPGLRSRVLTTLGLLLLVRLGSTSQCQELIEKRSSSSSIRADN